MCSSPNSSPLETQRGYWDEWNVAVRSGGVDEYQSRQLDEAVKIVKTLRDAAPDLKILEVGCGTGWLSVALADYGEVTATDFSEAAIEVGRRRAPEVRFVTGDFASVDLGGPFDLVVSVDVIAHFADHQKFIDRIRDLLRPGGSLILMTQNGFIWRRSSLLQPQKGQLRNWPTLAGLRTLLAPSFEVVRVRTIVPGGDRGFLRVVNSRWISRPLRTVGLGRAWTRVRERVRIGRDFVVVARRR